MATWHVGVVSPTVVSDVSHNLIGHSATDSLQQCALVSDALEFALQFLCADGTFVAKVRQGLAHTQLVTQCRKHFAFVDISKPAASRSESAEVYLVCKGFEPGTVQEGRQ